jgi:hypothetical protein
MNDLESIPEGVTVYFTVQTQDSNIAHKQIDEFLHAIPDELWEKFGIEDVSIFYPPQFEEGPCPCPDHKENQ